jgi:hypothetical protein
MRARVALIVVGLIGCVAASPVAASEPTLQAHRVERIESKNLVVLKGSALVGHSGLIQQAHCIEVHFGQETNQIARTVAVGNVRLTLAGTFDAFADEVVYDADEQRIVLRGRSFVQPAGDLRSHERRYYHGVVQSDWAVVDLSQYRIALLSPSSLTAARSPRITDPRWTLGSLAAGNCGG